MSTTTQAPSTTSAPSTTTTSSPSTTTTAPSTTTTSSPSTTTTSAPSATTQAAVLCAENEYVSNNACIPCVAGTTNAAGDDPSGPDTSCETLPSTASTSSDSSRLIVSFSIIGGVLFLGVLLVSAIYLKRSRRHRQQSNDNNTKKIEMRLGMSRFAYEIERQRLLHLKTQCSSVRSSSPARL